MSGEHDRLVEDGPLSDLPADAWSAEVRAHVESCAICKRLIEADALLSAAAGAHSLGPFEPDHARREAHGIPLWVVSDDLEPFPDSQTFRGPDVLELSPTERGVRAWDPQAREITVFLLLGRRPVLLDTRRSDQPGVGLEIELQPEEPAQVVAVSTHWEADPLQWQHWLTDHLASGGLVDDVKSSTTDKIRVASARVGLAPRPSRLRLQNAPLAASTASVKATLARGRDAGMQGNAAHAAVEYQTAAQLASRLDDEPGRIRALIGLSTALRGLSLDDDADDLLTELVANATLDHRNAARICQMMARSALWRGDVAEARIWADELQQLDDTGPMAPMLLAEVAAAHDPVGATLGEATDAVPAATRVSWNVLRARIRADAGDPETAESLLADLPAPLSPVHAWLRRVGADVALAHAADRSMDWDGLVMRLESRLGPMLDLPGWDEQLVVDLARRALLARRKDAAQRLVSLAFRSPDNDAPDALIASRTPQGLLIADANDVRLLPLSGHQLLQLIRGANDEVARGRLDDRIAGLGALLFPNGVSEHIEVLSDGVLAGAPISAAAMAIGGLDVVPSVEFRLLRRKPPTPASNQVASFADAHGDLPFASREVQLGNVFRGYAVTRASLADVGPVGLLHIGVHCKRENGLPGLVFADGPLSPADIAVLDLSSHPVVMLAGCATASRVRRHRAERSLAGAFLRAGASNVIGTHWPVEDREIHGLVTRFAEAWPVREPARTIARICTRLRLRGASSRLWASPVVYR